MDGGGRAVVVGPSPFVLYSGGGIKMSRAWPDNCCSRWWLCPAWRLVCTWRVEAQAAPPEHRHHPRRRHGLRRPRRVRQSEHPHAAARRDGGRGTEVDELLRAAGLLAEPRGAADRTAADPQRHVRRRRRAAPEGASRQRARRGCRSTRSRSPSCSSRAATRPAWSASGTSASCRSSCRCARDSTPGSACRSRTTCG